MSARYGGGSQPVCAYSMRAAPRPTVSLPLTWDEIDAIAAAGDTPALHLEAPDIPERVERVGDLWSPALDLQQELPV